VRGENVSETSKTAMCKVSVPIQVTLLVPVSIPVDRSSLVKNGIKQDGDDYIFVDGLEHHEALSLAAQAAGDSDVVKSVLQSILESAIKISCDHPSGDISVYYSPFAGVVAETRL
jgi:hypothetical protein